jgi:cobalt/nickel transport system permease protein
MHIPDGFLNAPIAITTSILAATGLVFAIRDIKQNLPESKIPLIGLSAAFIFAAQMLNFPVAAGTSGHLIGGTLAAILLGPSAAVLVMAAVLILQCLMFADGGITALGANIFNLGIVAPITGFALYKLVLKLGKSNSLFVHLLAITFAGWASTVVASIFCSIELALSDAAPINLILPAMTTVHMFIGLGEAAITAFVLANVFRLRPDFLLQQEQNISHAISNKTFIGLGLMISLVLAIFIAPFASSSPDGLEFVAENFGFISNASSVFSQSPLPDYSMPGIESGFASSLLVGTIGTMTAFIFAWFFARWLSAKQH